MINLLNRIAIFLSFSFSYTAFIIILFFMGTGSYIDFGEAFFVIFFGTIFGAIIKKMFFSRDFIEETVVIYSQKLLKKLGGNTDFSKQANTENIDKTRDEYKTPYVAKEDVEKEEKSSWYDLNPDDNFQENSYYNENINTNTTYTNDENEDDAQNDYYTNEQYINNTPSEPSAFEKFFAENALAKIGGIIIFIGVLFFLGLLYTRVGPVMKIVLGFIAGFALYMIGVVLDKKSYPNESRVLLGLGILVNYLVILSGRYLIGEGNPISGADQMVYFQNTTNVLTEGTTFLFLILNTIFAIVTSLVYKSKTLLLFSFVFAYLNPFLIGAKSDGTPYTLVGYSLIVSLGAFALSIFHKNDGEDSFARYLNMVGFVGGNILFLIAPYTVASQWIIKLVAMGIVSLSSVLLSYKLDNKNEVGTYFIGSYIFFSFLLISGGSSHILNNGLSFVGYMSFILILLIASVFLNTIIGLVMIGFSIFLPLIIIFFLLVTGSLFMVIPVIIGTLFVYLIIFSVIYKFASVGFKYIYFILLGMFLIFSNFSLRFVLPSGMDYSSTLSVIISSIIFLFASYYLSSKEKLEYLYSIGTIGTIFLLIPILSTKGDTLLLSVISIVVFAIANILLPFINRNLCKNDLKNLSLSLVFGILFIAGELYNYGELAKLFPGLTLGFSFAGLAILYFILGFAMMSVFDIDLMSNSSKKEELKNTIYSYLGVSVSLFSIAILIIFSDKPAIIASIWFFESTILLFFFSKIKDLKIFTGAMLLFIIGLFKYFSFVLHISEGDYAQLVPIIAITGSFILNLKFLEKTDETEKIIHDILHIIAIIMVSVGVNNIIIHSGLGFSMFATSLVLIFVGLFYSKFASGFLKNVFLFFIVIYYFAHISSIDDIFRMIESVNRPNLKLLQYFTMLIPGIFIFFVSKIGNKFENSKKFLLIPYLVYVFIISTYFVKEFTDNLFAITIYWAIWAFVYIYNGINNDLKTRRTIGLYILVLVILKVFYDIFVGINDSMARVVALIFVGGLMVYISTLYSSRNKGNLLGEFDISNLFGSEDNNNLNKKTKKEASIINEKISNVDIGDYNIVIFNTNGGKTYKIKSKNLIRISKLIMDSTGKNIFEKGELKDTYTFVINNYQSELNSSDFTKIKEVIKDFIDNGGNVVFE